MMETEQRSVLKLMLTGRLTAKKCAVSALNNWVEKVSCIFANPVPGMCR